MAKKKNDELTKTQCLKIKIIVEAFLNQKEYVKTRKKSVREMAKLIHKNIKDNVTLRQIVEEINTSLCQCKEFNVDKKAGRISLHKKTIK